MHTANENETTRHALPRENTATVLRVHAGVGEQRLAVNLAAGSGKCLPSRLSMLACKKKREYIVNDGGLTRTILK